MTWRGTIALLALSVLLLSSLVASAARAPRPAERLAILRTLHARSPGPAMPIDCANYVIRVSQNPLWASVGVKYLTSDPVCLRYAANPGLTILKRPSAVRWKIVYGGSDPPPCSMHVPKDLWNECLR